MRFKLASTLFIILAVFLNSCKTYERVNISGGDFFSNNEVLSNIHKYDVYVNKGNKIYRIDSVSVSSNAIIGSVKQATDFKKAIKRRVRKRDLQISARQLSLADTSGVGEKMILLKDDVRDVTLSAKNKQGIVKTIVIGIAAVIVAALLIWAMVAASSQASSQSSQQSGNSNSNSNSGGSNSGCYIATMAYGDYDHPRVMVLRSFRDRFLLRHSSGKKFVLWYYRNSPVWVTRLKDSRRINACIRQQLNLLSWFLKKLGY